MKPLINGTRFGSITINGQVYNHDVVIRLDAGVIKRNKKLSKAVYGSSHTISLEEIKYIYEKGACMLIIGSGQYGLVQLSAEAAEYLKSHGCGVTICPTPQAVAEWNRAEGRVMGLFHVTC